PLQRDEPRRLRPRRALRALGALQERRRARSGLEPEPLARPPEPHPRRLHRDPRGRTGDRRPSDTALADSVGGAVREAAGLADDAQAARPAREGAAADSDDPHLEPAAAALAAGPRARAREPE